MDIDFKFGISQSPMKDFQENIEHQRKLNRLLKQEEAPEIIKICKHYVQNFVPSPVENENEYWLISVYGSSTYTPVRLNIFWHEVMNIAELEEPTPVGRFEIMMFTDRDYFTKGVIETLKNEVPGCVFDEEYRYEKGLDTQLAVFVPLQSYFKLVTSENIQVAIRQYNHRLSCRGRIVHKGHNFPFARILFEK